MHACFEAIEGKRSMEGMWCGDHRDIGLGLLEHLAVIHKEWTAGLSRTRRAALSRYVGHADDPGGGYLRQSANVRGGYASGTTDHGVADGLVR